MDKLFLISFDDPAMWRGLFALAAVLVALLAVVIGLGVHFGYSVYREKRYLLTIQRETSTVRFYRVNRMDDQVTYFNLSDMADVKTSTCAQFYASFPASERERLSTWVDDLLDGKVTPDYLELDVYIGKRRNRQLRMTESLSPCRSAEHARWLLWKSRLSRWPAPRSRMRLRCCLSRMPRFRRRTSLLR